MDKTTRIELIKKLVSERQIRKVKRKIELKKTEPVYFAQIEHTEQDVLDELVRLDSFAYMPNKKKILT